MVEALKVVVKALAFTLEGDGKPLGFEPRKDMI